MTKASFRFSPKILARLGEELNQSADQSISELVKNAYDADAKECVVELANVTLPGGRIVVADNGDGMDPETIRDRWLVLGRSSKATDVRTNLGRAPAGSKGLGRLAALRMGERVVLNSVQRGISRRMHELKINWVEFEGANVVEDVELDITSTKNVKGGHGTRTQLIDLKRSITSDEIKRLARSLLLLTDPFSDEQSGFQVKLIAPEFEEVESLIRKKYFQDADFHLHAEVGVDGRAKVQLLDWRGEILAKDEIASKAVKKDVRIYKSPAAKFDAWIFLLGSDTNSFSARKAGKGEIQEWLRAFGGIHVYQDEIRVTPYGNPGNDWLEMNLSRAKNPEERPSTNTSIGRVQIQGAGKHALVQKTDRSGFIEDEHFLELKAFLQDSLDWLARWRLKVAEKRRAQDRADAPKAAAAQKNKVDAAILLAPPAIQKKLIDAFSGYEKSRDKEADGLRKEIQLYRTLSTAGITAATFSHESQGNPIKRIELAASALKTRVPRIVKTEPDRVKLLGPVSDIESATRSLATLGNATLSLVRGAKRRLEKVGIHPTLDQLLTLMEPFALGMSTTFEKQFCTASPYMRTSQAAMESIFANLINNSLAAFEHAGASERMIKISTQIEGDMAVVSVSDSGPGITLKPLSDIWLPGVTGKAEGTGLGLTIVRDTVKDMGGRVDVEPVGPLGGALFRIYFPIMGS